MQVSHARSSYRLATLTFLLVAFGSSKIDDIEGGSRPMSLTNAQQSRRAASLTRSLRCAGDFIVLISRIAGILLGVLVSLMLAVVVFPKSATQECLSHMKGSLEALLRLSEAAWPEHLQNTDRESKAHHIDMYVPLSVSTLSKSASSYNTATCERCWPT